MEFVVLGKIISAHGIKGDVKIFSLTDFPSLRFKACNKLELYNELTKDVLTVTCVFHRILNRFLIVHFEEFSNPEAVLKYKGYFVRAKAEAIHKLPKDSYYNHDLINCKVIYEDKEEIGIVIAIESNGRQDLIRIKRPAGKTVLIPLVEAWINSVDIINKTIIINRIEGLLE